MKKFRIFLLLIIIAGAGYFAYDLYLREYGMYKEAMKTWWTYDTEDYLREYPEGRWIEEVKEHWVDIHYRDALDPLTIRSVRSFRRSFPDSKYDERMITISDSLWNREISHYEQISNEKGTDANSVDFFRNLMHHMRDNHLSAIYVKFKGNIDLKDFSEYTSGAKELLDADAKKYNEPVISQNILSLKENFDAGDAQRLEEIVDQGIGNSLKNVFEQGIIGVYTWKENAEEISKDSPVIELNYYIRNSAFIARDLGIIYPDVWTYTVDRNFQTYLLGINIDFDFNFKLPGSEKSYSFSTSADPGESLSNMTDVRDAYRIMTRVTFQNYAQEISDKFGLGIAKSNQEGS